MTTDQHNTQAAHEPTDAQATPIPCALNVAGTTYPAGTPFCDVIDKVMTELEAARRGLAQPAAPLFTASIAARKWQELQADGHRMTLIRFDGGKGGPGSIDPGGIVMWGAQPAAQQGERWGWAIVDKHGVAQAIRPWIKDFYGAIQVQEPFTQEDVAKTDREWPGLAPHRVIALFQEAPKTV